MEVKLYLILFLICIDCYSHVDFASHSRGCPCITIVHTTPVFLSICSYVSIFLLIFRSSLHILDTSILLVICIASILFQFVT